MSTFLFDSNKYKNKYEINNHLSENVPFKNIYTPETKKSFNSLNDLNIYKKLSQNQDKKHEENDLFVDLKLNLGDNKVKKDYLFKKYNDIINSKNYQINLKNFLNETKHEKDYYNEHYKEIYKTKKLSINNRYNKYNDIKRNNHKKIANTLISNSIDIINNNPFNKMRLNKSESKKIIDINNINNLLNNYNKENYSILKDILNREEKNEINRKKSKYVYSLKNIFLDNYKEMYPYLQKNKNNNVNVFEEDIEFYNKEEDEDKNNINLNNIKTIENELCLDRIRQIKEDIERKINPRKKKKKKIKENKSFVKYIKEKEIEKENERELELKEKMSDDDYTEYYISNSYMVLEFSYKEEINYLNRNYMEDKGKSILNFNDDPKKILFCLFDGHGGDSVSNFLQKNFAQYMKKYLKKQELDEEEDLDFEELFKEIDEKLKEQKYYQIGSTATIIYIIEEEENKKILYCVNIGDTRCILTQTNGSRKLSYDDLATDKKEFDRINNEGGYIFNGRVCGKLMLSRAFGDWEQKTSGVISCPHITKIEIDENCKYVIIASDGVWDVLDDLDVYSLSLKTESSKDLCHKIIDKSLEEGSEDNISCFVIKLNN